MCLSKFKSEVQERYFKDRNMDIYFVVVLHIQSKVKMGSVLCAFSACLITPLCPTLWKKQAFGHDIGVTC